MYAALPEIAISSSMQSAVVTSYSHAEATPRSRLSECVRQNVNCCSLSRRVEQLSGHGAENPEQS